MTSSHIIFIPAMILVGMFIGFILGARAARNSYDLQLKRDAEREAAREARAARRAAQAQAQDGEAAAGTSGTPSTSSS